MKKIVDKLSELNTHTRNSAKCDVHVSVIDIMMSV